MTDDALFSAEESGMISVKDLRVAYGTVEAVRGVTFSIAAGEVVAMLGRNGAGKTSTLQVLAGHRLASAGSVRVHGFEPWQQRAQLRPYVGIMLQEAGFLGELTVAETVDAWRRFGRAPLPRSEVLAMVDLSGQARVRVNRLSGGQRRRLDLALAVLHRPRVLFLDEPTTGLDPEARHNTWAVVEQLAAGGVTVLLTTHYLEEAERLARRVLVLDDGLLSLSDDIARVVAGAVGTVSFRSDTPASAAFVEAVAGRGPEWTGVRIETVGGRVVVHSDRLDQTAAAVFDWAARRGVALPEVAVRPASLEDVYLGLSSGAGVAR